MESSSFCPHCSSLLLVSFWSSSLNSYHRHCCHFQLVTSTKVNPINTGFLASCYGTVQLSSLLCYWYTIEKSPLLSWEVTSGLLWFLWVISHCWWPFICHHFWGSKRFVPGDDMSASSLTFHRKQIYFSICTRTLFRGFFVAFCHIHLWSCFYLSHCNKLYYSVMP